VYPLFYGAVFFNCVLGVRFGLRSFHSTCLRTHFFVFYRTF
jgi:hypothetical protein